MEHYSITVVVSIQYTMKRFSLCIDLVKDIASSKTHLDSLILKYKKPRYGSVYFQTFKWCTSEMHSNFQNLFNLK
ncbi:CGH_1_collapsed_G0015390.mRNA.1.CDS.1 [Saccharomyces cerevisiae]|nr:CGH_1_collapsed_G0015390.mRNA.1.CDS.1 [Saccharomyces cerevisiae]